MVTRAKFGWREVGTLRIWESRLTSPRRNRWFWTASNHARDGGPSPPVALGGRWSMRILRSRMPPLLTVPLLVSCTALCFNVSSIIALSSLSVPPLNGRSLCGSPICKGQHEILRTLVTFQYIRRSDALRELSLSILGTVQLF